MTPECRQVQDSLSAYLDGVLDQLAAAELEAHLQRCPACNHELESLRKTVEALHSLEQVEPPANLLGRIHAETHRAPRQRASLHTVLLWPQTRVALAAALVLVVCLYAYREFLTPAPRALIQREDAAPDKAQISAAELKEEEPPPALVIPREAVERPARKQDANTFSAGHADGLAAEADGSIWRGNGSDRAAELEGRSVLVDAEAVTEQNKPLPTPTMPAAQRTGTRTEREEAAPGSEPVFRSGQAARPLRRSLAGSSTASSGGAPASDEPRRRAALETKAVAAAPLPTALIQIATVKTTELDALLARFDETPEAPAKAQDKKVLLLADAQETSAESSASQPATRELLLDPDLYDEFLDQLRLLGAIEVKAGPPHSGSALIRVEIAVRAP